MKPANSENPLATLKTASLLTPISSMNACCRFASTSDKKVKTWLSQRLTLSSQASSGIVTQVAKEALFIVSEYTFTEGGRRFG